MELIIINTLMVLSVLFGVYITQSDRNYWCKRQWGKLWKN